jgi:hypothetical protein
VSQHEWIGAIGGTVGLLGCGGALVFAWLAHRAAAAAELAALRAERAVMTAQRHALAARENASRAAGNAADAVRTVSKYVDGKTRTAQSRGSKDV